MHILVTCADDKGSQVSIMIEKFRVGFFLVRREN